jgi:hypothetical protein
VHVVVSNANGAPIEGAELRRTIWTGGQLDEIPRIKISSEFIFDADANARNIVCELSHPRYAPLVVSMVRNPTEQSWMWTHPNRQVITSGQDLTVGAVLGRLRWPPTSHIPEDQLKSRAAARKRPVDDQALAQKKDPPKFVPLDESYRSLLTTQDGRSYRLQDAVQPKIADFHVVAPDLVGVDPTQPGWGHFAFRVASIDPARSGHLYFTEFGEVASNLSGGRRFLVGLWVPETLTQLGVKSLDFIVWLHPSTGDVHFYPKDTDPYRTKYPFAIWAETLPQGGGFGAPQRYVNLPIHHLFTTQHFLQYQMEAARRNAVIVIPIAPSGDFGPLLTQPPLFRLLKELCLWIPRGDSNSRGMPGRFPPTPNVGKVAVSAFSSSGPHLNTLMANPRTNLSDQEWGARPSAKAWTGMASDDRDFEAAWSEMWSIDSFDPGGFSSFVGKAIDWYNRGDRYLRIYKSEHTGGWDLENPKTAKVKDFISHGRTVMRGSGNLQAVVVQDPGGRWSFAYLSDAFMSGPSPAAPPPQLLPDSPHEMMPRLLFGHAAGLSGLTRL